MYTVHPGATLRVEDSPSSQNGPKKPKNQFYSKLSEPPNEIQYDAQQLSFSLTSQDEITSTVRFHDRVGWNIRVPVLCECVVRYILRKEHCGTLALWHAYAQTPKPHQYPTRKLIKHICIRTFTFIMHQEGGGVLILARSGSATSSSSLAPFPL
ncbi:hypothetical protein BC835DRAFT_1307397 [Cytidiella melzeri]|nr:hypothetical protein BC835DRAFT_1307397 [Cytidiella melzeri]